MHKLENLTTSYNSIEKSLSFLSDKVGEFNIKLQNIVQKINNYDIRLNANQNKMSIFERDINILKRDIIIPNRLTLLTILIQLVYLKLIMKM